jgi:REP element-mobilizing transposase RayT
MPQSLALVIVHIIFSTKDRAAFIRGDTRDELHAYLATIARNHDCECYCVGGVADHVHVAVRLSRTTTVAKLVSELKATSSRWMKKTVPAFAWQRGYGAFSVGPSDLKALRHYVETQEEHHRKHSFQDEFRAVLKKYGVEYDERYVWD